MLERALAHPKASTDMMNTWWLPMSMPTMPTSLLVPHLYLTQVTMRKMMMMPVLLQKMAKEEEDDDDNDNEAGFQTQSFPTLPTTSPIIGESLIGATAINSSDISNVTLRLTAKTVMSVGEKKEKTTAKKAMKYSKKTRW
jgi:hypothetical protein